MAGRFIRVACGACEHEVALFEKASTVVRCGECDEVVAEPTGGLATLHGDIVEIVEGR